jgi:hypothetical protein
LLNTRRRQEEAAQTAKDHHPLRAMVNSHILLEKRRF